MTRDVMLDADAVCDTVAVAANATVNLNGHALRTGGFSGGGTIFSARIDDGVYAKKGLELLSYAESPADNKTVNCYVDTGYIPAATDRLETKFRTGGDISETQWIFGTYTSNKRMDVYVTADKLCLHLGGRNNNAIEPAANTSYDIVLDGSRFKALVSTENAIPDSAVQELSIGANKFSPSQSIYLFGAHGSGTYDITRGARSVRMQCFRVFDADGNLKVNMLPARKNGVVGFYDTVRDTFCQPANGTLAAGETISYIALESAGTPAGNNSVLVDTGYWPRGYDSIDATVSFGSVATVQGVFSSRATSNNRSFSCCITPSSNLRFDHLLNTFPERSPVHCNADGIATVMETGKPYRIHADGNSLGFSLNGVEAPDKMSASFGTLFTNMVLFALADSTTGEVSRYADGMSMHGFRITDMNGYVRLDLVPAKLAADGTVGFYDRARNAFIRPQGGALAGGAELPRDLTRAGGACAMRPATVHSGSVANLFNDNFTYATDASHRVLVNKESTPLPVRVDYDFGAGNEAAVNMYRLHSGYNCRAPKTWTLYGSNDDLAYNAEDDGLWTKLDARDSQDDWTLAPYSYQLAECRAKVFANDTAYRYYRLKIEKTQDESQGYAELVQIEYFRVAATAAPGVLRIGVAEGASVANATVALGADLKVEKDGEGEFAACAPNSFYTGGTEVMSGTFTVGAPLSTAMTLSDGATLGFLLSQDATSPLLSLDAASSFPATFDVAVGRSDSFKIPKDGFTLTDGFSFTGKTATLSNPSDFARKVKVDGDGNLIVAGRSVFMLIVK